MATLTLKIGDDVLKELKERAAKEDRTVDEVASELLRKALEPYKLEWKGWDSELLVDVADRKKLYDVLYDDEYMKKRGFRE